MQTTQSGALRTMVARVSPDDIVIYANGALASYLDVPKHKLIGTPLDVVASRCKGEISSCFARPETGRGGNQLVTDDSGRVFEAKLYSDGGVLDIVLDEVTTADSIGRELRDSSGTAFASFSEDELRTTRHPERRYLTVTRTHLRGLSQITERLAPMEVRLMVNSFVEEACDAVFDTGCTVGETSGDSILGIFGAPRYFTDHPLRAIRAACDQMYKAAQLHAGLYREGKELPPCSCGMWTGDTLVGTLGNSMWQHYTSIGLPVELAGRLSQLARPGEVLLPEHTLTHLLRTLPEGWQHVRAESEFAPDMSDFQWSGEDIAPMPEHLRKIVYLVGPGVQASTDNVEYYFDYLWSLVVPGREQPTPILRVVRPSQVGDSLELSDNNVVTTQVVQTLGKYKLVEVLGTGGMGKVWRGVDRFGNAVAIKVLHSSETVTEAQLKRFRREAEVMARLPHRNICRVYEMNEFDGIQFIAMEFVDGLTLSDLLYERTAGEFSGQSLDKTDLRSLIHSLKAEKSRSVQTEAEEEEQPARAKTTRILPVEQTLSVILKVCDAVQFAHEHGVLHRDLKPGNILLREDGEPLVADFGLAKLSDADATHSLSVSGHVVGTLENMSPEQAESSKDVDERADVYSIGTMLYQMLTGRRHFEATGNIVADAQTLKTHEPVRLRAFNPQIASDLEIITLKALRNDTAERYRSVAALQADIEHYRRGEVISARPVSFVEVFKKLVQRNKG
ncbi:MAG: protein kinase domain-containing protein, partial [Terrimicrobiaceae bacterium]